MSQRFCFFTVRSSTRTSLPEALKSNVRSPRPTLRRRTCSPSLTSVEPDSPALKLNADLPSIYASTVGWDILGSFSERTSTFLIGFETYLSGRSSLALIDILRGVPSLERSWALVQHLRASRPSQSLPCASPASIQASASFGEDSAAFSASDSARSASPSARAFLMLSAVSPSMGARRRPPR